MTWHTFVQSFGLACFALATFGVGGKFNLVAAGLFCWLLSVTIV